MARKPIALACTLAVVMLIVSVAAVQAAPVPQGEEPSPTLSTTEPGITASPTSEGRLTTATPIPPSVTVSPEVARPSPTLLPPPSGGGRVEVDGLFVRDMPSFGGVILGVISYGQSVYPVGRNSDTRWIAINWQAARGWVYVQMVVWDSGIDLTSLPVLAESTGVPLSPTPAESAVASATPAPSPTAPPTDTPSQPPLPTRTPIVTEVSPPVRNTPTAAPVVAPQLPHVEIGALPVNARLPVFGGLGLLILAGLIYVWQWSAGRAEVRRYARGFVLSVCPVCREGHVHLDEVVRKTGGIQWVRRLARCNNCRSVIREIRPGMWRYAVDASLNPELAERFKTRHVTTAELQELAKNIVLKADHRPYDEPTAESLKLNWLEIDEPLPSATDHAEAGDDGQDSASDEAGGRSKR